MSTAFPWFALLSLPGVLPLPLAIDCGPPEAERPEGWLPDREHRAGAVYGYLGGRARRRWFGEVSGPAEPEVMRTWREGEFEYRFALPAGDYAVAIAILETEARRAGERVFDVLAGERSLFSGIDPFAIAGLDYVFWLRARATAGGTSPFSLRFRSRSDRPPIASAIRIARLQGEAPAVPAPRAVSGLGEVALFWDAGPHSLLGGYRLERAGGESAPEESFRPIGPLRLHTDFYLDRAILPGRAYRYRLLAFDLDDRPLSPSRPALATPFSPESAGLPLWRIEIDPEALARIEKDPRSDLMEPARVALGPAGAPEFSASVRRRGGSTRALNKGSWKVKFQKGATPDGRSELCLKAELPDHTLMQEKLSSDVFEALGLHAPRCRYALLSLNGACQGVYLDVEVPNGDFKRRAGLDPEGLLARSASFQHSHSGGKEREPHGRRRGRRGNLEDLDDFVRDLNTTPQGELEAFFRRSLRLDRAIDFLAASVIVHRKETEANDLFYYRHPGSGKWELIPWDQNNGTWGMQGFTTELRISLGIYPQTFQEIGPRQHYWWVLWSRLLTIQGLRARYLERLSEIAERVFPVERIEAMAAANFRAIEFAAERDFLKWPRGDPGPFREGPRRIGQFYRLWRARILELLARERARPPAPVIVNEFLPGPGGWIELMNRGAGPAELGHYRLVPRAGGERILRLDAEGELSPGERVVLRLADFGVAGGLPAGSGGFALLPPGERGGEDAELRWLLSAEEREERERDESFSGAELIYCGPAPPGASYGRTSDGDEGWRWFQDPTPGDPNRER